MYVWCGEERTFSVHNLILTCVVNVDFRAIQVHCARFPCGGAMLSVTQVPVSDTVQVFGVQGCRLVTGLRSSLLTAAGREEAKCPTLI
jgi:hypothetical protein